MTDVKLRVSTAHRILARILARFSLASLSPSFNLRSFFQEGGFFWEGCQVQKDTRPFSIDSSLETRNWTLTGHRIPSLHCSQPPLRTWITRYTYTYYISRRGQTSQNRDTFVYTVMYTGLGRIGSFTTSHHRRQHQGFPWTRGSREMRGSRVGRGRKFGARTAAWHHEDGRSASGNPVETWRAGYAPLVPLLFSP